MNAHDILDMVDIILEALFRIIYAALLAVVGWLVFLAIVGAWNIEIPPTPQNEVVCVE